jgi:hypothetical protein
LFFKDTEKMDEQRVDKVKQTIEKTNKDAFEKEIRQTEPKEKLNTPSKEDKAIPTKPRTVEQENVVREAKVREHRSRVQSWVQNRATPDPKRKRENEDLTPNKKRVVIDLTFM